MCFNDNEFCKRIKGVVPKPNNVDLKFVCPMDHPFPTWFSYTLKLVTTLFAALVNFIIIKEVVLESVVLHVRMKKGLLYVTMMLVCREAQASGCCGQPLILR